MKARIGFVKPIGDNEGDHGYYLKKVTQLHDSRAEGLIDLLDHQSSRLYSEHPLRYPNPNHQIEAQLNFDLFMTRAREMQVRLKSIRRYQRRRNISGIVWRDLSYCGYSVRIPTINEELSATRSDARTLSQHKGEIIDFLIAIQKYFRLWRYRNCSWEEVSWKRETPKLFIANWINLTFRDAIVTAHEGGGLIERPEIEFHIAIYLNPATDANDTPYLLKLTNHPPSW